MNIKRLYSILLLLGFSLKLSAQGSGPGKNDTVLVYGVVVGSDTLPFQYLQDVNVIASYLNKDRSNQMKRLRYNVYTVYPYAVSAAKILNDVDQELAKFDKRRDRKKYLKAVEDQMNAKFKDKLKNMTTTQGLILVKLINRQTGRDCYSIVKELKGGFNARIWQTAAFFFDNNLKTQYDPYNKDKDIEQIVREIESKNYFSPIQNVSVQKIK